jgi:hypothetical protein
MSKCWKLKAGTPKLANTFTEAEKRLNAKEAVFHLTTGYNKTVKEDDIIRCKCVQGGN